MSRDQQIGLALGILLVGAVSAFFFRHEEPTERRLPVLKTAADLDRQIAERPHAPYLTEAEEPARVEAAADPLDSPDPFASSDPDATGLVPEPIVLDGELPDARLASHPVTTGAPAREVYHIVRSGDTLSSIAQQYLGSTARYQDVFEANRDRLRTPNDLRIGQELRIPVAAPVGTQDLPGNQPAHQPAAPSMESQPGDDRRFVPYRGSPLTPGPKSPDASAAPPVASPVNPGRRLSQLPPKDGAVVR
uniref:LysM peptidoglycan-binding domain-containing protein n=1 Tax=Schlesneria paludicola TaxID=360056 RepID=A0A7C2PC38_9PLAN